MQVLVKKSPLHSRQLAHLMTITEFVAQRMRDAQQKGEISPDINTAMTSRLLLDLTYGVLADIEAEDLAREASFAQGLRAMIGGILTAS